MATDAEINLKVNIPQPKGPDIEKMLADIKRLGSFTRDYLKEAAKGADIAEAAKIGRERAAKVGEEVAKNWEKGFADGFKNVATMGRAQQKISLANEAIYSDVTKAEAAWREGKLTDQQMVALLTRRGEQQNAVYDKAGNLKNMVGGAETDLRNLEQMEELLTKHERFSEAMRGEAEGARALALELRNSAGALEDEAEALDLSIPGNEKRKLQLLQQAKDERTRANAVEKSAEVIEAESAAIDKNIAAVDGSAESYEKANKAIDRSTAKALDQKKKLVELGAKQAISDQQQIVKEQQLAEQQERRATAEAKRAKQEEMLREKELYQNSLLGKTKLELAKILSDLNKQRKEAVKIGDAEAIERLNMQYSVARSAMRQASMQANVTRMMFMQQAQTASRLSGNITTLAQGFADLANYSKIGTANLSGMASSLMDLWFAFKAGMGPVGWVMLGLQGIQMLLNKHGESIKKAQEAEKKHAEQINIVADTYKKVGDAQRAYIRNKKQETKLEQIRSNYEAITEEIRKSREALDEMYRAEEKRLALLDREEKTRLQISKMQLNTKLAAGEMSRADYDRAMLKIDKDAANIEMEARTRQAAQTADKAVEALKVAEENKKNADSALAKESDGRDALLTMQAVEAMEALEKTLKEEYDKAKRHYEVFAKFNAKELKSSFNGYYTEDVIKKLNERTAEYRAFDSARRALTAQQELHSNMLNGMSIEDYKDLIAQQNESYRLAKTQQEAAEKAEKNARETVEKAQKNFEEIIADNENLREEQNRLNIARINQLGEQEQINKDSEARQKQISELQKKLDEMTIEELRKALDEAYKARFGFAEGSSGYGDWTRVINTIEGRLDKNPEATKRRKKEIQKLREEMEDMSLKEMRAARKRMTKSRGKYAEGTAAYNDYEAARAMFDERIKSHAKQRQEIKKDVLLEARIDSNKQQLNAAFFTRDDSGKTLFDQIMGVDDDGVTLMKEAQLLLTALKRAQKLRNAELESVIQAIIQEQANNERNSTKTLRKLNKATR